MAVDLRGLTLEELEARFKELGQPAFRARQVFQWVQARGARDPAQCRNVGPAVARLLEEHFIIGALEMVRRQGDPATTAKYLFALPGGERVETVLMSYAGGAGRERRTVCVSSQVGCPMGCAFCATGRGGWRRNLDPAEMVGQVLEAARDLDAGVTNVVFMGMGEPLLNYEAVVKAIHILNHPLGLNIGARRITVSTCGVVPGIRRLAGEKLQVVLAVSLHAPEDELRSRLMPINRKYPLAELLPACREYIARTGRRVTFEYILIRGVNDSQAQARQLAALVRGMLVNINLIPANPLPELRLQPPGREAVAAFARELEAAGVTASVRHSRGNEIEAACGQLRRRLAVPADELEGGPGNDRGLGRDPRRRDRRPVAGE